MNSPINILLVEDNDGDARLVRAKLAEVGIEQFAVTHARSLSDAQSELGRAGRCDVILLDLGLPESTGLETLRQVRQAAQQVPIVVLTGLDDEVVGLEALRSGAQDYLLKGQTDGRSIARAIRYAIHRVGLENERQQHLARLNILLDENRRQREFLQQLIENAPVGIAVVSGPQARLELINAYHHGIDYLSSLRIADMVGRPLSEVFPHVDSRVVQIIQEVYRKGEPLSVRAIEAPLARQNQSAYWDIDYVPLRAADGSVEKVLVLAREVTEQVLARKKTEDLAAELDKRVKQRTADLAQAVEALQSEVVERTEAQRQLQLSNELLERVFSVTHLAVAHLDRNFNFVRVNRTYADADGRTPDFFVGKNHFDLYPNEENERIFRRVVETTEPYATYEKAFVYAGHPERGVTYWDWSLLPIRAADGKVEGLILSLLDVTKRRKMQEALRQSEDRLRMIFETARTPIAMIDLQGGLIRRNPAYDEMFASAAGQPVEGGCAGLTHPDDMKMEMPLWQALAAGHRDHYEVEKRYIRLDGKVVWGHLGVSLIRDEKGQPQSAVAVITDITARKAAEERVAAERQRLYSVLNLLPGFVFLHGPDHTIRFANHKFRELFGEPGQHRCFELIYGRNGLCEECPPMKVLQSRQELAWERTLPAGQTYRVFDYPFTDVDGTPLVLELGIDISDRKRMEEALRESDRISRAILDQSFEMIGLLSPDGTILEANRTALEFAGLQASDVVGKAVWATPWWSYSQDEQERLKAAVEKAAAGRFVRYEAEIRGADGSLATIDFSIKPVTDDRGKVIMLIPEGRDISERRRLEAEVAKISARERERIGQDLHDTLGQELTGVAFMAKVLSGKLSAEGHPAAKSAREIGELVNRAIARTRALARGLCPVDLEELGLMTALKELALRTEQVFGLDCQFKCPRPVVVRNNVVATNLYYIAQEACNNAVRHANASRIAVKLTDFRNRITLTVKDDGVGLSPNANSEGMGLHIMSYRAGAIGASLEVTPGHDGGTVVKCVLPQGIKEGASYVSKNRGPRRTQAEDNPD